MRKIVSDRIIRTGILAATWCVLAVSAWAADSPTARHETGCAVASEVLAFADSPWPPFTLGEEGGPATGGRTLALLQALFGGMGKTLSVTLYPWQRTLKLAETGRVDGIPILMRAAEREAYLAYTDRLITVHDVFYFNRKQLGSFDWDSYEDLRPLTIGLVKGYTYSEDFMAAAERFGLKVEYSRSPEVNFSRLYAGRVDLVLDEEITGDVAISNNPDWGAAFGKAEKPTASYDYFMAFSRKSPYAACIPWINERIRAQAERGTINRILKNEEREPPR